MENLELGRKTLIEGNYSCVVVKDDKVVYTSFEKGVKPLFQALMRDKDSIRDCTLADKVIGRAAALLALHGGIRSIYAEILGESALELLKDKGTVVEYGRLVPHIKNRDGSDKCPMEKLVEGIEDPDAGFEAIKGFIAEMMAKR